MIASLSSPLALLGMPGLRPGPGLPPPSGNIAYVVQPDGGTTRLGGASGRVNEQGHAHMTKHGSELKPGSVLYRANNKLYALNNDNQLQEGKFLADHVKGWVY